MKAAMERFHAALPGLVEKPVAKGAVGGGPLEEPIEEPLQVERRSTHDERAMAASPHTGKRAIRLAHVARHVEGLSRVCDVEQVVGHATSHLVRGFGRSDVHAPIDLHGVEGKDLGADAKGDLETDVTLSRGGRADQEENRVRHGQEVAAFFGRMADTAL